LETSRFQETPEPEEASSGLDETILPKGAILENRYEILKVLGSGGMAAVYQARDLRFSGVTRLCAVKEMVSTIPDPHMRRLAIQNFQREANILASLNHPAIPSIYDFFSEGIRNYLVLEFIEGRDLEALLGSTEAMLPQERVVDWAVQICDVLSYLHSQTPPIVFRDMKPSNVMLRPPNHVMLIDFGIARMFESGQKGTMIGTEGYSPPEQYKGIANPQGDIYALGATLHHLLTRRDPRLEPPFTFHEEPPRLLNPAISAELETVIMKALEYDPEKRFASADEMKAALLQCVKKDSRGDALARKATPTATTGTSPSMATRHIAIPEADEGASMPTPSERAAPPVISGSGGVLPIWQFKCEDEVRSSPFVANGTLYVGAYDNNLYALDAKSGEFQWKFPTDGGIAATPCIWKDRILFGSEDRLLYSVSAHTGRILWTCPTEGRIRSSVRVEFEHAFFGSDDHRLYAVNAQTGRMVWRFEALGPIRSSPAVGDEAVYVGSEDSHLYAVDLQSGNQRWKFRANRGITSSPILHGGLLIFGASDWNVYALDEHSGWSVWRFRTGQAVISSPRVVDGVVYIGSADSCLYALDVSTGRQVWKFDAGSQIVSTPVVADNMAYFGTIGGDVVSVNTKNGKEHWRFTTGGSVPGSPFLYEHVIYIGSADHKVYALPA
jgi:outer membrane protein assembly factor BamB/serine/threonine protein kinase